MAKLQVNDDGTVTFPLKGREPLTLDEPSMADLGWLTAEVQKLDKSMPVVETLPQNPSTEQLDAFTTASRARTLAIYDPDTGEMPYGKLIIDVIKRFTDGAADVSEEQLYGWAASPATVRTILEHFRAPLPGPAFPLPT